MADINTAKAILEIVGGSSNIEMLTNCATRLRFTLKDTSFIKKAEVEKIPGVLAAIPQSDTAYQIVIGPQVEDMRKEIEKVMKSGGASTKSGSSEKSSSNVDNRTIEEIKAEHRNKVKGKKVIDTIFEYLSDSFRPIIGVLLAASLVIAIVNVFIALKVIPGDTSSPTVLFFKAISQSVFYFIAIFVAYNACKKLKVDPWLGVVVMMVFITPQFLALQYPDTFNSIFNNASDIDVIKSSQINANSFLAGMGINDVTHIFGIPMLLHDYSGNVFVPLLMCPVLALVYNFFKKVIPVSMHLVFVPGLVIVVMCIITGFIIGPIGIILGTLIGNGLSWLNTTAPLLLIFIIPIIYPFLVPLGLHWPLNALMIANINTMGYDFIQGPMGIYDFACYGASFGVLLIAIRENNKNMKAVAGGAVSAGLLGGISEPSLYGIHLRFKRAYVIMFSGCIAGAISIGVLGLIFPSSNGVAGVTTKAFAFTSLLTVPVFDQMWVYGLSIAIAFTVPAIIINIFDYRTEEQKATMRATSAAENLGLIDIVDLLHMPSEQLEQFSDMKSSGETKEQRSENVFSPIDGKTIKLENLKDKMFRKKVLGEGIAIYPSKVENKNTEILSPVSGVVKSVARTKHAYTIMTDGGIGVLVHVGLDTVNTLGKHFESFVKEGDNIKVGEKIASANFKKLQDEKYEIPVVVCIINSRFLDLVEPNNTDANVGVKESIIKIDYSI